jgi:hypothetical protein
LNTKSKNSTKIEYRSQKADYFDVGDLVKHFYFDSFFIVRGRAGSTTLLVYSLDEPERITEMSSFLLDKVA